jgi:perosamine synthetase
MISNVIARLKGTIKEPVLDFVLQQLLRTNPAIGRRAPFDWQELKLLRDAVASQNLFGVDGRMVPQFEREFAEAYGSPYAVASTSGTAAIHTALGALDLNPGDEVITAPITDLGTIIPILSQAAIPIFADVDDTYNMDPADVERKITPRTRAIIVVHLFGNPCDMDAMADIARRHKVVLIEDCAQAHFAEHGGRFVGTIGDIGCFSFQQSKHMTTGDGGMTITSNKTYYERMKLFTDKGYARKGWGSRAYVLHAPNYRMTELVGAVGLAQLKKIKPLVARRNELGLYMTHLLAGIEGLRPVPTTERAKHAYWLYPMSVTGVDVDTFGANLKAAGVGASVRYTGKPIYLCAESLTAKKTYGNSQFPFSARSDREFDYVEGLCPRAERGLDQLVCLPLDETWTRNEVERVAGVVVSTMQAMATGHGVAISSEPTSRAGDRRSTVVPGQHQQRQQVAIGIVGCGQMGRWHLDSYKQNPGCRVVAVADTDFAKAQAFAAEIGGTPYHSHREMMANEQLQGVSVCTLPATHRDVTLDVLRGGIHVLCEKPLAVSAREAREMLSTAEQHNALLLTAFKFRFFDEVVRAKELVERGSLGRILTFRLMFGGYIDMAGTWYAQKALSGGGILMDNGPHAIDLVRFVFGDVRSITARLSRIQDLQVEDTAQLTMTTEGGAVGTVDLSWSSSVPARSYLEIYGEDGAVFLDGAGLTYKCKAWKDWKRVTNDVTGKAAFARQIDHFVAGIAGTPPTRVVNHDGLAAQMLIEAAYQSSGSQIDAAPVSLEGALVG